MMWRGMYRGNEMRYFVVIVLKIKLKKERKKNRIILFFCYFVNVFLKIIFWLFILIEGFNKIGIRLV